MVDIPTIRTITFIASGYSTMSLNIPICCPIHGNQFYGDRVELCYSHCHQIYVLVVGLILFLSDVNTISFHNEITLLKVCAYKALRTNAHLVILLSRSTPEDHKLITNGTVLL